ncbi:MAG: hypothetical protein M1338_05680 [Patescibacteria group bacterium]|nr:hypothetical protein [Patescibacteria group bacterium]
MSELTREAIVEEIAGVLRSMKGDDNFGSPISTIYPCRKDLLEIIEFRLGNKIQWHEIEDAFVDAMAAAGCHLCEGVYLRFMN